MRVKPVCGELLIFQNQQFATHRLANEGLEPVCGEFQFTRQLASEISHRSAVAIDMSRGGWSEAKVHRSSEPA